MNCCNFQIKVQQYRDDPKSIILKCGMGPTLQHRKDSFSNLYEMKCEPEKCVVWQNYLMLQKLTNTK